MKSQDKVNSSTQKKPATQKEQRSRLWLWIWENKL